MFRITLSSAQKRRLWWLYDHSPHIANTAALAGCILTATLYLTGNLSQLDWMGKENGWQFDGFAGFGGMSGFTLAALSLVASVAAHPRAKDVIDSTPGRYMLRCLIRATWFWFVPAVCCLLYLLVPRREMAAIVVATALFAIANGFVALLAVSLFFRRFTAEIIEAR